MTIALAFAFFSLVVWIYLLLGRGMFWLARERDDGPVALPAAWPTVTAIVPARNEADAVVGSLQSLLAQDYPGVFRVLLIDDESTDRTAEIACALNGNGRLEVQPGGPRPQGWTGKLWAVKQGVDRAGSETDYLLITDADIVHTRDNLRQLVARAEAGGFVLTSLMAKLRTESFAEKLLIPAFVFFFAMLYPFAWVNRKGHDTAAAAGGCMLVRRTALEQAGGIESIRGDIIDDCALARRLKTIGGIWLGLTERVTSIRPYPRVSDIRRMVARSAYAQLGYSPVRLLSTLIGMFVVYVAPAVIMLLPTGVVGLSAGMAAGTVWLVMLMAYQPILAFYRLSAFWGLAVPLIGAIYALFTLDSAIQYWRGRGGMWKGRVQALTQA